MQPEILRLKIYEPVLVAGEEAFEPLDIRVRVKGGGHISQVYAIRQAIAKALVAYYAKYLDAYSAMELKKKLVAYDRTLLIADPRRMEPKKFGGHGARARRQKRYESLIIIAELTLISSQKLPLSNNSGPMFYNAMFYLICHHAIMHIKSYMHGQKQLMLLLCSGSSTISPATSSASEFRELWEFRTSVEVYH